MCPTLVYIDYQTFYSELFCLLTRWHIFIGASTFQYFIYPNFSLSQKLNSANDS